jgi:hypothetical protein
MNAIMIGLPLFDPAETKRKQYLYLKTKYHYLWHKHELLGGFKLFSSCDAKRLQNLDTVYDNRIKGAYNKLSNYCDRIIWKSNFESKGSDKGIYVFDQLIYKKYTNEIIAKYSDHDLVYGVYNLKYDMDKKNNEFKFLKTGMSMLCVTWNENSNEIQTDDYKEIFDEGFFKRIFYEYFKIMTGMNYVQFINDSYYIAIKKLNLKKEKEEFNKKTYDESLQLYLQKNNNLTKMVYDKTNITSINEFKETLKNNLFINFINNNMYDGRIGIIDSIETIGTQNITLNNYKIKIYIALEDYFIKNKFDCFDIIFINLQKSNQPLNNIKKYFESSMVIKNNYIIEYNKTDCTNEKFNTTSCVIINKFKINKLEWNPFLKNSIDEPFKSKEIENIIKINSVRLVNEKLNNKEECYGQYLFTSINLFDKIHITLCGCYLPENYKFGINEINRTNEIKYMYDYAKKINEETKINNFVNIFTGDMNVSMTKNKDQLYLLTKNTGLIENKTNKDITELFSPTCKMCKKN